MSALSPQARREPGLCVAKRPVFFRTQVDTRRVVSSSDSGPLLGRGRVAQLCLVVAQLFGHDIAEDCASPGFRFCHNRSPIEVPTRSTRLHVIKIVGEAIYLNIGHVEEYFSCRACHANQLRDQTDPVNTFLQPQKSSPWSHTAHQGSELLFEPKGVS